MVMQHLPEKNVGCMKKGTGRVEDILYCTTNENSLVRVPGVYSKWEKN
jgi:hypothetical protein